MKLRDSVTREALWDTVLYCLQTMEDYEKKYKEDYLKDKNDTFSREMSGAFQLAKETMEDRFSILCEDK